MKKNSIFFCLLIFFTASALCSNELMYARQRTNSLDIELSEVNLIIAPSEENRISYRFEPVQGKRLSSIETNYTLRIRELLPVTGTLYVFVPKDMLLESCIVRSNRAAIDMSGMRAVHTLLMMNNGTVTLSKNTLKNAVINIAWGKLAFDSEILRSCAFSVSGSTADISLKGKTADYNLDYTHANSKVSIDSKEIPKTKNTGIYGNPKAKRRIIFSAGSSQAAIRFSEQEKTE